MIRKRTLLLVAVGMLALPLLAQAYPPRYYYGRPYYGPYYRPYYGPYYRGYYGPAIGVGVYIGPTVPPPVVVAPAPVVVAPAPVVVVPAKPVETAPPPLASDKANVLPPPERAPAPLQVPRN
jgi:hypothetical protein